MKNSKKILRTVLSLLLIFLPLFLSSCEGEPLITPPENPVFSQERVITRVQYGDEAYKAFYENAEATAVIPGLKQGFIPQGMDYLESEEILFISGYFKSNSEFPSSVLFAVDAKSGDFLGEYFLKKPDGAYLTGHVGGTAVTEKNIFIADGGKLYRYPLKDLSKANGSGNLQAAEAIAVPTLASYCNYADGVLYVGDFYLPPNYETPEWRHLTDANGKKYGAWCAAYRLTEKTESEFTKEALSGEAYAIPDFIFATETKVQGFTVMGDTVVLSRSHGRANDASIAFYSSPIKSTPDQTVSLAGREIPIYFLDGEELQKTVTTPPMTEGVCIADGGIYILFESAASYYKDDGGKNPVDRIYHLTTKEK